MLILTFFILAPVRTVAPLRKVIPVPSVEENTSGVLNVQAYSDDENFTINIDISPEDMIYDIIYSVYDFIRLKMDYLNWPLDEIAFRTNMNIRNIYTSKDLRTISETALWKYLQVDPRIQVFHDVDIKRFYG